MAETIATIIGAVALVVAGLKFLFSFNDDNHSS